MKTRISSPLLSSSFQILYVVMILAVAIGSLSLLSKNSNTTVSIQKTSAAVCTTPFDSGQAVQMGPTESNVNNMENRWPISTNRHEYDFFSYFVPASPQEAQQSGTQGGWPVLTTAQYTSYTDAAGNTDANMAGFMGKMFGYKPSTLADAVFRKYSTSALQGADTLVKGTNPGLVVQTDPNADIFMPDTGYSLGGGFEAMVEFAAEDRVTLHIGRHEYFVGNPTQQNCVNASGGKTSCSGGYWIYLSGICVDKQIQNAYTAAKSGQEAAAADKSVISMPMIETNRVIGKAIGNSVDVIVRDNGPLIAAYKPFYWTGVPTRTFTALPPTNTPIPGAPPTNTPVPGAPPTNTPIPGVPTDTPTPTLTPTNTPTPTPDCGLQVDQNCCSQTTRPVPLSEFSKINPNGAFYCFNSSVASTNLTCQVTQGKATCKSAAATPVPTNTPIPTATPTPYPPANTLKCQGISNMHPQPTTVVFIGFGYSNNSYITHAQNAMQLFKSIISNQKITDKFDFVVYQEPNLMANITACTYKDPSGGELPCWDEQTVGSMVRACSGDIGVILVNPGSASAAHLSQNTGVSKVSHQIMALGDTPAQSVHGLLHTIAQMADERDFGTNVNAPAINPGSDIPYNCSVSYSGNTTKACTKWSSKNFTGVGCYKGCGYTNWYRSADKSIMHNLNEQSVSAVHLQMLTDILNSKLK